MKLLQTDIAVIDNQEMDKIKLLSEIVYKSELFDDLPQKEILSEFIKREKLSSTGFGNNIAIPHALIDIKEPMIKLIKLNNAVDYDAIDGQPINTLIIMIMPSNGKEHLKYLSNFARNLMIPDFISVIKSDDITNICKKINEAMETI